MISNIEFSNMYISLLNRRLKCRVRALCIFENNQLNNHPASDTGALGRSHETGEKLDFLKRKFLENSSKGKYFSLTPAHHATPSSSPSSCNIIMIEHHHKTHPDKFAIFAKHQ